jgi:hypothetical protein
MLEEIIKNYKPIYESFVTQQECEYADYQAYQNDLRSDLWKLTNLAIINNGYPIFCILWKRAVEITPKEHFFFEDKIKATWEIYQGIEEDFLQCLGLVLNIGERSKYYDEDC